MELQKFFKDYMNDYKGLDIYRETVDGQYFNEWNYEDGCLLLGCKKMYEVTGDDFYREYIIRFMDPYVKEDGEIKSYVLSEYNLDFINAGKLFYFMYDETGEERWKKAADKLMEQLHYQPRLTTGNFWHKLIYPFQVWLDGLYMAQPFYMEYETRFHDKKNYDDIFRQFFNVEKNMRDPKTGLYYHAYDSSRAMFWCDKVTGLSQNFWLRALGWFSMALLDTLDKADASAAGESYEKLKQIFVELMDAMLKYQDESGMWYQVVNFGGMDKNYLETSGSSIMAYALLKGVRLGFLPESYRAYGEKAFHGICDQYLSTDENGNLNLDGICLVAGLGGANRRPGTYDYYMSEPVVKDDAKGVGPFLLAYTEMLRLKK